MNVVSGEYIKIPPIPDAQKEALSRGDILWQDAHTKIFYPENPLVPAQEGIHLRIESVAVPLHPKNSEEWKGWLRHWGKTIGAGKVISEGVALPDIWQNFIGRTEFTPQDHLVTDVIGRSPEGESWTKTAPLPDIDYNNRDNRLPVITIQRFQRTLDDYFRRYWIPSLEHIKLFDRIPIVNTRVIPHVVENKEWSPSELSTPTETVFSSDMFDIVAVSPPHLRSGVHLMVGLGDAPKRPWRDLTTSLEGLAAAEATAQILERTNIKGTPLAAWTSVRATGSWFGGFTKLRDTAAYKEGMLRKWLKRRFRGAGINAGNQAGPPEDWEMFFHPHIYGGRKNELIRLTQRPAQEGGADWEGIEAMSKEKRAVLREALNTQLPKMVDLMKGPLK